MWAAAMTTGDGVRKGSEPCSPLSPRVSGSPGLGGHFYHSLLALAVVMTPVGLLLVVPYCVPDDSTVPSTVNHEP